MDSLLSRLLNNVNRRPVEDSLPQPIREQGTRVQEAGRQSPVEHEPLSQKQVKKFKKITKKAVQDREKEIRNGIERVMTQRSDSPSNIAYQLKKADGAKKRMQALTHISNAASVNSTNIPTTSKYGAHHQIILSSGTQAEQLSLDTMTAKSIHNNMKGVSKTTETVISADFLRNIQPGAEKKALKGLQQNLSNIPVNSAAQKEGTKPTKLTITIHSQGVNRETEKSNGLFAIPSGTDESAPLLKLGADCVPWMLSAALKPGDYHGKLTINLNSCHTASPLNDEQVARLADPENTHASMLGIVAKYLHDAGIKGVKVTGSESMMKLGEGSSQTYADTLEFGLNGAREKLSPSSHKYEVNTSNPKAVRQTNPSDAS